jgi:hypothetical protein
MIAAIFAAAAIAIAAIIVIGGHSPANNSAQTVSTTTSTQPVTTTSTAPPTRVLPATVPPSTTSNQTTVNLKVVQYAQRCYNSQLNSGTLVTATGDNGTQLAAAGLSSGSDVSVAYKPPNSTDSVPTCTFSASLVVPTNQNSYAFTVGSLSPVAFSLSQMSASAWNPTVTTGCVHLFQGC